LFFWRRRRQRQREQSASLNLAAKQNEQYTPMSPQPSLMDVVNSSSTNAAAAEKSASKQAGRYDSVSAVFAQQPSSAAASFTKPANTTSSQQSNRGDQYAAFSASSGSKKATPADMYQPSPQLPPISTNEYQSVRDQMSRSADNKVDALMCGVWCVCYI
jgi:hypothetical protein